mmetsp:Transcript_10654/g.23544  ORF Transcript_10654/g.23544 Transcript_10654/m.23544 type:complete len:114 (+) Transcript_10654:721-1062(+)
MPRMNAEGRRWNGWNAVERRSGGVPGGIERAIGGVVVGGIEEIEKGRVAAGEADRGAGVGHILGLGVENEVVGGIGVLVRMVLVPSSECYGGYVCDCSRYLLYWGGGDKRTKE